MLQQTISSFLKKHGSPKTKYLLGVSGGVDSMVLLDILQKLNIEVLAVHFNFMLRAEEANLDQVLVEDFCKKNSIPYLVRKEDAQEYADKNKMGIQEAARDMRYAFFREVMVSEGAGKILTAHQADDQVETVLFNLLRSSGIKGLAGMPVAENDILRPMISVPKDAIYQYAKNNHIPFREDKSNASDKYQRNFLRNQIIPQLVERFPNAKENILRSARHLKDTSIIYEERIEQIKKKLIEQISDATYRLPIRKLIQQEQQEQQETILFELFKNFGLTQTRLPALIKLLSAHNGAALQLDEYTVYKDRNVLLIQKKNTLQPVDVFIEEEKGDVQLHNGVLQWELINRPLNSVKFDKNIATLDAKNILLPFKIRQVKEGDFFYPLGMKKKKKLSRYFIDNKYSPVNKEQALVLEMIPESGEGDKRIMWLIGDRIDNRFRISKTTKSYYQFTFKPLE